MPLSDDVRCTTSDWVELKVKTDGKVADRLDRECAGGS